MATPNYTSLMEQFADRLKKSMAIQFKDKVQQRYYTEFSFKNICENVNFQQQAKDDFGNLHPQYVQPVRKGYESVEDYVQLYTHDILNAVRQIDLLCIKTSNRNYDNYEKCKSQTNEDIRRKVYVPIVNSSALLYKVSNLCLLKGNSIDMCTNLITEHTYFMFKLAAERAKLLTEPLKLLIPKELEPPRIKPRLNNAIKDD